MTIAEVHEAPTTGLPQEVERAVNTREAAQILGVGVSSMEKWRVEGSGPPYRKWRGRVTYLPSELKEWRDRFKRHSTSENPSAEPEHAGA